MPKYTMSRLGRRGEYWCHLSKASAKHKIALFPTIRHLHKTGQIKPNVQKCIFFAKNAIAIL